ncbi:MAG: hypothetical protein RBG13Loki_2440 [Promethearchaeota archaeon CR_4]|nr:MAG: hypothetical protein RBG13Loki_2440 [Candidatus Lokiarchaeota archaeon CR_4]
MTLDNYSKDGNKSWNIESTLRIQEIGPSLKELSNTAKKFAEIFLPCNGIPLFSEVNDLLAFRALGRLVSGRVRQLFEVILVGAVPDVHLGFNVLPALKAILPPPRVSLVVMGRAQGIPVVIAVVAVRVVRKQDVLILVIADPLVAALSFRQAGCFSAKTTLGASVFRCYSLPCFFNS